MITPKKETVTKPEPLKKADDHEVNAVKTEKKETGTSTVKKEDVKVNVGSGGAAAFYN